MTEKNRAVTARICLRWAKSSRESLGEWSCLAGGSATAGRGFADAATRPISSAGELVSRWARRASSASVSMHAAGIGRELQGSRAALRRLGRCSRTVSPAARRSRSPESK